MSLHPPLHSRGRRARRWPAWLGAGLAATTLAALLVYAKAERIVLAAEAYLYGYPLVILDLTRASAVQWIGPENQLHRVRQFPDAAFKGVVRPNVDTLYTSSFIDMADGPWVFEMAANAQRYEVMAFMDGWTNVFAALGTRSTGVAGARFLLVGPGWQGDMPEGLTPLRAPTRIVWLIGRTQTNGAGDYPLVRRLQDGLTLSSLADWRAGPQAPPTAASASASPWQRATVQPAAPVAQLQALSAPDFFAQLALLMVANPPAAADGPMLLKLERLGLGPGRPPQWGLLDRWAVGLGRWIADRTVARELQKPRDLRRGWSNPPAMLGQYGTHYNIRAVVAMVGLGANLPADAMYPNTRVDGAGQRLNGSHHYRLHFPADGLPPVHAFWSVTAYGDDDYLIDNPAARYALGDRDPLAFNADGSLDLWLQADPPPAGRLANWLPVRAGEPFLLNARLYWPKPAALDGSWGMPAVERLD